MAFFAHMCRSATTHFCHNTIEIQLDYVIFQQTQLLGCCIKHAQFNQISPNCQHISTWISTAQAIKLQINKGTSNPQILELKLVSRIGESTWVLNSTKSNMSLNKTIWIMCLHHFHWKQWSAGTACKSTYHVHITVYYRVHVSRRT